MNHHDDEHDNGKGKMCDVPVIEEALHCYQAVNPSIQRDVILYHGYNFFSVGTR